MQVTYTIEFCERCAVVNAWPVDGKPPQFCRACHDPLPWYMRLLEKWEEEQDRIIALRDFRDMWRGGGFN
jgi:hypothetical protein